MNDEDEILPPSRGLPAPARRTARAPIGEARRVDTGGVLLSAVTGWQARAQARAIAEITERTRNETALLKAQTELANAYETTALKVNRLRKLPQILELDDAKFRAEQEAGYEAVAEGRAEREQQLVLTDQRRFREIAEAEAVVIEARRRKFTIAQGYENQQRLKKQNLDTWKMRAAALRLDAEAKAAKVQRQVRPSGGDAGDTENEIRQTAERALTEALADGDDAQAVRWRRILDALD
jgi:hypothetical protein